MLRLNKWTVLSIILGAASLVVGMIKEEEDIDASVEKYLSKKESNDEEES